MPTGYTAHLLEKNLNFPDFALLCARAFGALVTLRDESMDAPLPAKLSASTDNARQAVAARKKLKNLLDLDQEAQERWGAGTKNRSLQSIEEGLAKAMEENRILDAMIEKVRAWTPPSPEHEGLKEFMLNQCTVSKNNLDYWQERLRETARRAPKAFYIEAVATARQDIKYHKKEQKEEDARTASRNLWLSQLRESLASEEVPDGEA